MKCLFFFAEIIFFKGSLKCDCREQLDFSLEYIKMNPPGVVIYLQQEGRGMGLANKIKAYNLQEVRFF
jgi:GTP cyclohydrolase II